MHPIWMLIANTSLLWLRRRTPHEGVKTIGLVRIGANRCSFKWPAGRRLVDVNVGKKGLKRRHIRRAGPVRDVACPRRCFRRPLHV